MALDVGKVDDFFACFSKEFVADFEQVGVLFKFNDKYVCVFSKC